jgi:hypothetical protein
MIIYLRTTVDLLYSQEETKEIATQIINEFNYKKIKEDTIDYFIEKK